MTNAEKERHWARIREIDRVAIPLWLAGASLDEAYFAALRRLDASADVR